MIVPSTVIERPFVTVTQIPILGDIVLWLWSLRPLFQLTLIEAGAVADVVSLYAPGAGFYETGGRAGGRAVLSWRAAVASRS